MTPVRAEDFQYIVAAYLATSLMFGQYRGDCLDRRALKKLAWRRLAAAYEPARRLKKWRTAKSRR